MKRICNAGLWFSEIFQLSSLIQLSRLTTTGDNNLQLTQTIVHVRHAVEAWRIYLTYENNPYLRLLIKHALQITVQLIKHCKTKFSSYLNQRKCHRSRFDLSQQCCANGPDELMWHHENKYICIFRCFHHVRYSNLKNKHK